MQPSPAETRIAADLGFPVLSLPELLNQHADLLRRIRLAYGAEQADFDKEVRPTIDRFARYVHLLPATAASYFCSRGGLLHMSLEVAFYAAQAVDSTLFQGLKTISQRQHLEPRWRLATLIAGLCSEVHRAMTQTLVTENLGSQWYPYLGGLHQWATTQRAKHYQVRWVESGQESRAAGLFAIPHVVDGATMQFLANGNSLVVPHMLASVTGTPVYRDHSNVLDNLVRRAVALVVESESLSRLDFAGHQEPRAYLERYIVDAIRSLIAGGEWAINVSSSLGWYGADGAFLLWPRAGDDLLKALEREHLRGLPANSSALLSLMAALGLVRPAADGSGLALIRIPGAGAPVRAVHLVSGTIFRSALPPGFIPLAGNLSLESGETVAKAAESESVSPPGSIAAPRPPPGDESQPTPTAAEANHIYIEERAVPTLPLPFVEEAIPVAAATKPASAQLSLRNVPRLSPAVRGALSEIVATVGIAGAIPQANLSADGLFVPLEAFARRDIDTALAVESLSDAGMLVRPGPSGAKTSCATFEGSDVIGVLIKPSHVDGYVASPTISALIPS